MKKYMIFFLLLCAAPTMQAQDAVGLIRMVNDRWQASHPEPGSAFWHTAAYHTGNMAAYEVTRDERYRAYSERWAEHNQWKGASSEDKSQWKYNYGETDEHVLFGDWQTCFQTYTDLYNLQPDERKIARAREVMEYQMSTPNSDYWWWADGLYMVMPVMTKLYKVTGNGLYLQKLHEYFSYAKDLMYDAEAGLFYRDAKYIYPGHKTRQGLKDFWARGNGWVLAALAKVLDDLPPTDAHRAEYIQVFQAMAKALKDAQQPEGHWTRSVLDAAHAPGYETSGTAFFTFGFLWGINHGLLQRSEYESVTENAWTYLVKTALQPDGTIGYVQPIGERADQHTVNAATSADFGVGAFLLAASERLRFTEKIAYANEPDSTYIFAYANEKKAGRDGLHFAWSTDGGNWRPIGEEYAFVKCDYGSWGSEKRMLNPYLYHASDGLWHCVWLLNEKGDFAHVTSADLLYWGRQTYYSATESKRQTFTGENPQYQTVCIDGEQYTGTVRKVPRNVSAALINAQQLAAYRQKRYAENTKDDAVRFAGLQPIEVSITPNPSAGKEISDLLIGIFFEDINYAADGGLYAELIQNRDFEYSSADHREWNAGTAWKTENGGLKIENKNPLHPNNQYYAVLQNGQTIINEGYDGIAIKAGEAYDFSLFAQSESPGKSMVTLIDGNGNTVSNALSIKINSKNWKQYKAVLTANKTIPNARLSILNQQSPNAPQFLIDIVSLFPQNTFKGRKNGLRADLAQAIADIHPRFVRFPGGCVAHGDGLENMYRWKNTVGPPETRKPQRNLWGYHQTAGLGYYEYFLFCEDMGAEPLPVVPAGVPCQNSAHHGHPLGGQQGGIPMDEMDEYIQEILDLIEWANGDAKTRWGKVRAEAGHPAPFNLKYLGVGNEDLISDVFEERFTMIYNAVKARHPEITVIGTVGPFSEGTDYKEGWQIATNLGVPMVDEHYYQPPGWFIHNQEYYDCYDRSKSKVYLGEYAAHLPGRPSNIETALAEALHIINLERNGDVVRMTSYAPLLAKEGRTQWNPNLIYFNNTEVKPTVGYYVQQLCGRNSGDEYLPASTDISVRRDDVRKRIACSLVRDTKSGDLIIKLVNLLPVEVQSDIDLSGFTLSGSEAVKTVLQGNPDDKNARPAVSAIAFSKELKTGLPAYSFTIIRIKNR
ncbi:MAG: glycoside hydrolase family 88 protein [Tannerellaceae bacterium]|jgi:alpha-L-arabinofuranosidase/rhamnogalacturonyl hydrolase YesR|nr:glycoside hydrolase family 88 protein [Tannerellaceae bacterium]